MEQKSILKNYFFNTVKIVLSMVFPLITFPYVSRVLLPEGIGKVEFVRAIISYFIILASVGIPIYGARECSKVRDDKSKLSKVVHELIIINQFSILISYGILFIFTILNNKLYSQRDLILLLSTTIFFTSVGIEWFYQALEEFVYITIRSLIFQLVSLVLLVTLVKTEEDYYLYAFLIVLSSVGSNTLNFLHARKFISFRIFERYNLKRHIKPVLVMFAMSVAVSIYTNLDSVMLGFMCGDWYVGLFSSAVKINRLLIVFVVSIGSVLVPRISYYIEQKRFDEFNSLVFRSLSFIIILALPVTTGMYFLSSDIILLFSGNEFVLAASAMEIIAPTILIVGLSNLIGLQVLIPLGKEKYTLFSILIGAVFNFILNLILIPSFKHNGAAISLLVTETVVTITQLIFAWDYIGNHIRAVFKYYYFIALGIITLEIIIIKSIVYHSLYVVSFSVFICSFTYFGVLYLFKDDFINNIITKVFRRNKSAL